MFPLGDNLVTCTIPVCLTFLQDWTRYLQETGLKASTNTLLPVLFGFDYFKSIPCFSLLTPPGIMNLLLEPQAKILSPLLLQTEGKLSSVLGSASLQDLPDLSLHQVPCGQILIKCQQTGGCVLLNSMLNLDVIFYKFSININIIPLWSKTWCLLEFLHSHWIF